MPELACLCVHTALKDLRAVVAQALDQRQKKAQGRKEELIVDHILAAHRNDREAQIGDCLTYIVYGISRTASCECV